MKPALLFLCHRIPYPPNKGDKIRSWNLLKQFSQHYRVYMGCFVDDPADWEHAAVLRELCADCCLLPLNPMLARIRSVQALLSGDPLTLPYYYNKTMESWIREQIRLHSIERLVAYSSSMAQYALKIDHGFVSKMIDFVDIDSDKWLQYAENKSWPMSWLYRREGKQLHRFERRVTEYFDASLFVSSAEASLFREMVPDSAGKIDYFNNGVDTEYFSPDRRYENPFGAEDRVLVFTGAMDYWPNVDAVTWFAENVFPQLLCDQPELKFYIVGSNPTHAVKKLDREPGITVTGTVADVRPYLQYSAATVAPMRIARGVQNKVLEAMAMARPVIVSTMGLEGIHAMPGSEVLVADTPAQFVDRISSVLLGDSRSMGCASRERVINDFSWSENLAAIEKLLESSGNAQRLEAAHG